MKTFSRTCIALFLVAFGLTSVYAEKITLSTDVWMPFTGEAGSELPGFMTEVAREVFVKAGYEFEYRNEPWPRAISNAEAGNINGIIGCVTSEVPTFVFPKNELGLIQNAFFVLKDSKWVYKGPQSLEGVNLGVIDDYSYSEDVDRYLEKNKGSKTIQSTGGDDALETNIKKLLAKRIDTTVESSLVFAYTTKQMGVVAQIKEAGRVPESDKLFIAFSPALANSKKYAQILSDGIDTLRKSGRLAEILKKYSLSDWK